MLANKEFDSLHNHQQVDNNNPSAMIELPEVTAKFIYDVFGTSFNFYHKNTKPITFLRILRLVRLGVKL